MVRDADAACMCGYLETMLEVVSGRLRSCLTSGQSSFPPFCQLGGVKAEDTAMSTVGQVHGLALVFLGREVQVCACAYAHVRQRGPTDHLGWDGCAVELKWR